MFASRQTARCEECGEALFDGDSAYLLGENYYCTACVDDSLTVVRHSGRDEYDKEGDERDD